MRYDRFCFVEVTGIGCAYIVFVGDMPIVYLDMIINPQQVDSAKTMDYKKSKVELQHSKSAGTTKT